MARSKLNIENSALTWDEKRRYKVNTIVSYLGITYQNLTGKNTEPGVGTDWFNIYLNNVSGLDDDLEFTANGIDNFIDIGVTKKPIGVFLDSALLRKGDWSFLGTTITFTFIPNLDSIIQFI